MGLGDEIMALGRAEALYEQTGRPVSICNHLGYPREHDAWLGNPAWNYHASLKITDGANARPYIKHFHGRRTIFNLDHRPRAGRVFLTDDEKAWDPIKGPFALVAPYIKDGASPNKNWGVHRWEQAIAGFPIPVYQLCSDARQKTIAGAIRLETPTFRWAMSIIEKAAIVLCNEGGTHHMAASARIPAVVVFGAFTPPLVTGYDFHHNLAVETPEGYCGLWTPCEHCKNAMAQITPDMVKERAGQILGDALHDK